MQYSLKDIFRATDASGTRSTALQPLLYCLAILCAALGTACYAHAPGWLLAALFTLISACLLTLLVAYVFFMLKHPDAIRSERFTLNKMAIERGLIGDDMTGLSEPEPETENQDALLIDVLSINDEDRTS